MEAAESEMTTPGDSFPSVIRVKVIPGIRHETVHDVV